ncbi:MAG: amidohydrolase family protein [Sinobacteraceae bacterium]|nr:amidohydrolase family protein [Nevskiaceae bacterium]
MRYWVAALLFLTTASQAEPLAITGATLWTGTADEPVRNATIVISNEQIVAVGAALVPPPTARVIGAQGRTITAPLDAAATQIGLVEVAGASDTDDRAVQSGPFGAAFDVSLGVDANDLPVQAARAAGVARALDFPGPAANGLFAGQAARLDLAGHSNIVARSRVALFVTAGGAASHAAGGSRAAMWGELRNALTEARQLGARPGVYKPRDQLLSHVELEALLPVLARRIPLAVVAEREADIRQAVAVGQDLGINIVIVGGAEAWRTADLLASHHVAVVLDPLDELPVSYDSIGARRDNAKRLAAAGVTISFMVSGQGIYLSYDVGPALREGAGIAVANGLPYAQALRAITQNASEIWGDPKRSGTIRAGGPADLVIWDGDPLEPSTAPVAVLLNGREVSLTTRQTLLRDRYRPPTGERRASPQSP